MAWVVADRVAEEEVQNMTTLKARYCQTVTLYSTIICLKNIYNISRREILYTENIVILG